MFLVLRLWNPDFRPVSLWYWQAMFIPKMVSMEIRSLEVLSTPGNKAWIWLCSGEFNLLCCLGAWALLFSRVRSISVIIFGFVYLEVYLRVCGSEPRSKACLVCCCGLFKCWSWLTNRWWGTMTLSGELFLKVRTSEGVGVVDRPAIELGVPGVPGVPDESPRLGGCIVAGDDGKSQPCVVIWYDLLSPILGLVLSGEP